MSRQLPPVTQVSVADIDATPDADYPLRILRTYRQHCNVRWDVHGLDAATRVLYDMLNEQQEHRALILDAAIRTLEWAR